MPDSVNTKADQPSVPASGEPMTPVATRRLGIYFILLGLILFYLAFVIWPPDYQSLPASGAKDEDKGKNPLSPIVFFDCAQCPLKNINSTPTPLPKDKLAPPATVPALDGTSPNAASKTSATPVVTSPLEETKPAPATPDDTKTHPDAKSPSKLLDSSVEGSGAYRWQLCITYDQRLFLLVLILGALGSYIHAVMSFADFAGNRRLVQSWLWWYLLRPFMGAPMALVLYFAVRAGFMTASATGGDISRFGIATLAALAGMFSMKAADKLEEVFDVLFKTQEKRKDSLENSVPVLSLIKPAKMKVNSAERKIELGGSNFSPKAIVLVDNAERVPIEVTATKLVIELTTQEVSTARTIKLAVKNPPPGGGTSAAIPFIVEA